MQAAKRSAGVAVRDDSDKLSFSQTQKIGNVGIITNFVFPYIYWFLLYLIIMMLVNVKLDLRGYQRITF